MNAPLKYIIKKDVKFQGLEKIDIASLEKACEHDWFN
jgi:hypothetical protein